MPRPSTLRARLEQTVAAALASGTLEPLVTESTLVEDGGARFVVRTVNALAAKAAAARPSGNGLRPDPFGPPEPELVVADLGPTHLAVLNRYPVVSHHLLTVTREFVHQELPLERADFAALLTCLGALGGLAFYNSGRAAGASQDHRHGQLVPLPLDGEGPTVPLAPLLVLPAGPDVPGRSPRLPFRHALARRGRPGPAAARALCRALLAAAAIDPDRPAPYNLLFTAEWMLVVPRAAERFEGISLNALAFAGSLFVQDEERRAKLLAAGPLTALSSVTFPA